MKSESKPGNSIRKSCTFAFGAVILSTILCASAAHAQSACAYTVTDGRWAATCPLTSNTGYVWLAVNGSWQAQSYYTIETSWINLYFYGPKLWTAQDRVTGQVWVRTAQGVITYENYSAMLALSGLATLLRSQNPGAPVLTIVPYNWRAEHCRNVSTFQQYYRSLGAPIVRDPLCQ